MMKDEYPYRVKFAPVLLISVKTVSKLWTFVEYPVVVPLSIVSHCFSKLNEVLRLHLLTASLHVSNNYTDLF